MEEEEERKTAHEIGESLDDISVDELTGRIKLLEEEIERIKREIAKKRASYSQAEAIFKF